MSISPLAEMPLIDVEPLPPPDLSVVAAVLDRSDPELWSELWAPGLLPGETLAEARARRDVAADILDDLLAELAAGIDTLEVAA